MNEPRRFQPTHDVVDILRLLGIICLAAAVAVACVWALRDARSDGTSHRHVQAQLDTARHANAVKPEVPYSLDELALLVDARAADQDAQRTHDLSTALLVVALLAAGSSLLRAGLVGRDHAELVEPPAVVVDYESDHLDGELSIDEAQAPASDVPITPEDTERA